MSFKGHITFINLNDQNDRINIPNINEGYSNRNRPKHALEWILSERVGVMIASNMGRPGGACSHSQRNPYTQQIEFKFQEHAMANTQEESALTCIRSLVRRSRQGQDFDKPMGSLFDKYKMRPGRGTPDDFLVKGNNNTKFNIQTESNVSNYSREFGLNVPIFNPNVKRNTHDIYLSFISGPNASSTRSYKPRAARTGADGMMDLDTTFRTISIPAQGSYDIFKGMVIAALVGSLNAMADQGLHKIIMAAPGSGLYAGPWKDKITSEYEVICLHALERMRKTYMFTEVLVPYFGPTVNKRKRKRSRGL